VVRNGQTRKRYRSRTDRKLAGECGGLAQYFNVDATLMRGTVRSVGPARGLGLVIYLVLWIIVPEEPQSASMIGSAEPKNTMRAHNWTR
jgi:phage shock protein C